MGNTLTACATSFSWGTVWSTFVGFVFSIALFYITSTLTKWRQKKELKLNLKREIELNIFYLGKLVSKLEGVVQKMSVGNLHIFEYFKYDAFERYFISQYYQQGYLLHRMNDKELNNLGTILQKMNPGSGDFINDVIRRWKAEPTTTAQATDIINWEINNLKEIVQTLNEMKDKIAKKQL